MPIARAGALLVCAVASAALAGCFGPRMSTEAPSGVSLAGNWKLDPGASDDPQRTLTQMRAEAQKIINRANAAQGRPETPPPGAAGADASGPAHGARRDPLQYSAMAHVVEALLERSDHRAFARADEMVFDWTLRDGGSCRRPQRRLRGRGRRRSDLRLGWQAVRGQHQAADGPADHGQLRAVGRWQAPGGESARRSVRAAGGDHYPHLQPDQ